MDVGWLWVIIPGTIALTSLGLLAVLAVWASGFLRR